MLRSPVPAAVKADERNGQKREPDVRFEPGFDPADSPQRLFLPSAEQGGENEDQKCEGPVKQADARAADRVAREAGVAEEIREADGVRQPVRVKARRKQHGDPEGT